MSYAARVILLSVGASLIAIGSACKHNEKKAAPDKKTGDSTNAPSTSLAGKGDEAPKGFLTASDRQKPRNIKDLTEEELEDSLINESALYPDREEDKEEDDCSSQFLQGRRLKAQNKWLVLQINRDFADCMSSDSQDFEKYSTQLFLAYTTNYPQFKDADFDGKKIRDLRGFIDKIESENDKKTSIKKISEVKVYITTAGKDSSPYEAQITSFDYGPNGGPCETIGDTVKWCEHTMINRTIEPEKSTDYRSWILKDVTGKKGDTFYSSGTVEFTVNNWSGVITYKGKDTPPTWTAQSGSKKASGTLKKEPKA